jgi:RHS repeat-associated protein
VLTTISDRKIAVPSDTNSSLIDHYDPLILGAQDYYPFGMLSRVAVPNDDPLYAYGFNDKRNDNDVAGLGRIQDYGMRTYDGWVPRFWSVDPLASKYPGWSPYVFAMDRPIDGVDQDGLEWAPASGNRDATAVQSGINPEAVVKRMMDKSNKKLPESKPVVVNSPKQYETNKEIAARADLDPVGFGAVHTSFTAADQFVKGISNHAYGVYEGIEEKDAGKVAGNTALLALDLAPFFVKGSGSSVSVTLGMMKNEGASVATAAKVGAPYYSEWANLGIYNPSHFEGWGGAFKFVTDKVLSTKGTIHFELHGLNISDALAGDPNIWVGRYTAWELQQVTNSTRLFNNTIFYLHGVRQTAKQLAELGIKAPK